MQKNNHICKKGLTLLLAVLTMLVTVVPPLNVFADGIDDNNEGEKNQNQSIEVEADASEDTASGEPDSEMSDLETADADDENEQAQEVSIAAAEDQEQEISLNGDDEDDDHYEYNPNQKVTVKGKDFYYVEVAENDIGSTGIEIDFGDNNHVMAMQAGNTAYYFAPDSSSNEAMPDEYYYGSAGILYPDFWKNEGLSAPSAENWTASSSKVDSEGFNDMGGFDVVTRATSKHGTYRAPFQFITDVYGYIGTDKGTMTRFVSEHDPLISTVDGKTTHARQSRTITTVPADVVASCADGAKSFEVNGVTYTYDHYEIRGIQRVPVKIAGELYVENLVLNTVGMTTINHFEDFTLDGQDGMGDVVTADTGSMKELQANGEYGAVSAGKQTSERAKVVAGAASVNNNHSWGDYAEAQIPIMHADGTTMTTEDMLNYVTRFTSATYEYYGTDSTCTNMVARYGTMASVDTWWSTNHGNRVDAGFMFDSYRLGGDGQNKNIQLGYWQVTFRAAGYEDMVATFEIKPEISVVESSITLNKEVLSLRENINYTGNKAIEYSSSDESVMKISGSNGIVTGTGTATITATVNKGAEGDLEASASFEIIVNTGLLKMNKNEVALYSVEGHRTETLSVVDADGNVPSGVVWASSDTNIVAVTQDGIVTGVNTGSADITATLNGFSAVARVTYLDPSVTLDKSTVTVYAVSGANTTKLNATVKTPAGSEASWESSDPAVAAVSSDGTVTAFQAGETTIKASADGYVSECVVTVRDATTTLSQSDVTLYTVEGHDTIKLTATVNGPNMRNVTWASEDSDIATVSDGTVTAVKAGKTKITATANGVTAEAVVTVKNVSTSLDISKSTLYTSGSPKTVTLKATVVGPDSEVSWSSSKDSVATVNANGVVTAKTAGTATITAKANGIQAKCTITVIKPAVKLNKSSATIYTKGSTKITLKATITGGSKTATWKSSNSKIATVSSKGVVTAKKAGKATISVTANGVTNKCVITVKNPSLKLAKSTAAIKVGRKLTIKATATPTAKITYKSSNKKIATVTSKGVVKGIKKGTAKITITANGVKRTFKVTVK